MLGDEGHILDLNVVLFGCGLLHLLSGHRCPSIRIRHLLLVLYWLGHGLGRWLHLLHVRVVTLEYYRHGCGAHTRQVATRRQIWIARRVLLPWRLIDGDIVVFGVDLRGWWIGFRKELDRAWE